MENEHPEKLFDWEMIKLVNTYGELKIEGLGQWTRFLN